MKSRGHSGHLCFLALIFGLFGDIGGGDLLGLFLVWGALLIFVSFLGAESHSNFGGRSLGCRFLGTAVSSGFFFVVVSFAVPDSEVPL